MLKKWVFMAVFLMIFGGVQQSVIADENAMPVRVYQTGDVVSFEVEVHTGQLLLKGAAGQVRFVSLGEEATPSYTISPYDESGLWTVWQQNEEETVEVGSFQVADRMREKDEVPPTIDEMTWQFESEDKLLIRVAATDLETGVMTVQAVVRPGEEAESFSRNEKTGAFELLLDVGTRQERQLQLAITVSDFDGNVTRETKEIQIPAAVFAYQLNGQKLAKDAIVTAGDRLQIWTNRPKQVIEPFSYVWQTEPLAGDYLFPKSRLGEVFTLSNGTKLLYRENRQPFQRMSLLKNGRRITTSKQESFQKSDGWSLRAVLHPDYLETTDWRLTIGGHPVELKRQNDQLAADFRGQSGELALQYRDFDGSMHRLVLVEMVDPLPVTPVIQPELPPVEPPPPQQPEIQKPEPQPQMKLGPAAQQYALVEPPVTESAKHAGKQPEPAKKSASSSMPFPLWLPVGVVVVILIFAQNKGK
ncbi:hypothetical protein [Listeria costaricensis]|uniref:hypothetical protein n=1 Tax=Listeria costaricensis TaxID=2026604 RepID=UPI000C070CF8|nr:hypothetical protein [Listeria costaricensis]